MRKENWAALILVGAWIATMAVHALLTGGRLAQVVMTCVMAGVLPLVLILFADDLSEGGSRVWGSADAAKVMRIVIRGLGWLVLAGLTGSSLYFVMNAR